MSENCADKVLLPHHEQQELCTTRLPYRQGRKLTAVKVYTINNESNHLLIFGVPSLNLRPEVKSLFARFGKLLQFNITTNHPSEVFTETYHAKFEKIQSARIAKKMLDTKNFYGGLLHVCYAPELESLDETRQKMLKRKQDVLFRLRYLEMEGVKEKNINKESIEETLDSNAENECIAESNKRTMNMGEVNTIIVSKKQKKIKKMKPTPIFNEIDEDCHKNDRNKFNCNECSDFNEASSSKSGHLNVTSVNSNMSEVNDKIVEISTISTSNKEIDVIDFTSAEKEVVSNINEALNYNKFGNETIKKVPYKPVNRIIFNINNKNKLIYLSFNSLTTFLLCSGRSEMLVVCSFVYMYIIQF